MAVGQEMPKESSNVVASVLTTDFCPWANRFVYWLKEPVGWFVLATAVSVLIGMYFAPIGWTMAAALVGVIAVGMVWPWVAVRAVACSLSAETERVHEGDDCHLKFSVRNRIPLPIWGLAVEGFLDRTIEDDVDSFADDDSKGVPTVALAYVRAVSESVFRFSICPQLRGRYPDQTPTLTCSFPFGIWTARKPLVGVKQLTVWPKVFPIQGQTAMVGQRRAEQGEGNRRGRNGDFVGIRDYRHGDNFKQVNWVATARCDSLIVTQRSGPQCPSMDVIVDTSGGLSRDAIADRVRVAASILASLQQSNIPLRVRIGEQSIVPRKGWDGFAQLMDALTDVPIDGDDFAGELTASRIATSITIASDPSGDPLVSTIDPAINHRLSSEQQIKRVDREDLAGELLAFWTEVRDATLVA